METVPKLDDMELDESAKLDVSGSAQVVESAL